MLFYIGEDVGAVSASSVGANYGDDYKLKSARSLRLEYVGSF